MRWTIETQHSTSLQVRETLREYVMELSRETAASGLPMVRPLVLQFPQDPRSPVRVETSQNLCLKQQPNERFFSRV